MLSHAGRGLLIVTCALVLVLQGERQVLAAPRINGNMIRQMQNFQKQAGEAMQKEMARQRAIAEAEQKRRLERKKAAAEASRKAKEHNREAAKHFKSNPSGTLGAAATEEVAEDAKDEVRIPKKKSANPAAGEKAAPEPTEASSETADTPAEKPAVKPAP